MDQEEWDPDPEEHGHSPDFDEASMGDDDRNDLELSNGHLSRIGKSFDGFSTEASLVTSCVELGFLKTRKSEFSESGMLGSFKL